MANVDMGENIYRDCLQVQKVRSKKDLKLVTVTAKTMLLLATRLKCSCEMK